jgi:hypothetical protein
MRPHSVPDGYLQAVEATLVGLRDAYVESYMGKLLTPLRTNLKLRVRFDNGRLLEIAEAPAV